MKPVVNKLRNKDIKDDLFNYNEDELDEALVVMLLSISTLLVILSYISESL